MKLTYRPDLANQNRPKMCPDGFCGGCLCQCGPSHAAIKYPNTITAPANVPCAPGDSYGPCNPYSNFVDIRGGRKGVKWRQTCDEFPFGKLVLVVKQLLGISNAYMGASSSKVSPGRRGHVSLHPRVAELVPGVYAQGAAARRRSR
jgi:hypothetical protein